MDTCPHCGAPGAFDEATDGRCAICGMALPIEQDEAVQAADTAAADPPAPIEGTLKPADYSGSAAPSAGTVVEAQSTDDGGDDQGGDDDTPSGESLIKPRKLSPEFERRVTAIWHQTHEHFRDPQETIKSEKAGVLDYGTLHVGKRVLGEVDEPGTKDYELAEVIGEGAMGTVWSARQSSLDRDVAIKVPKGVAAESEAGRRQFMSEVVVTGQLDHPNIVPIYDLAKDDAGKLFYSMKRVEGRPWSELLDDGSKDLQENIEILLKVCDAIRFAHDRGVIHRDIKPHNVMVGQYGEVSVMDWGIAMRLPSSGAPSALAKMSPAGTPAYMAPEMATGSAGEIGQATDVYLLGAVLYQILTGEPPHPPPFDSQDKIQIVSDALLIAARNEITPIDKHDELAEVAYHAMATDVADRMQSVDEFQDAIRKYLSHAESIKLTERGAELLGNARANGRGTIGGKGTRFDDFDRARFALAEAIEIWPGNRKAQELHDEALLAYANYAYKERAYARGVSLLDRNKPEHKDLLRKLESADRRSRNQSMLLRAALAAIFLIVAGSAFFLYQAWGEARRQASIAEDERDEADLQRKNAEQRKQEADDAREIAEDRRKDAEDARMEADDRRRDAEVAQKLAEQRKQEADDARETAEDRRKDAEDARMEADMQRAEAVAASYAFEIGLAAEDVQRNSFDSAQQILDAQALPDSEKRDLRKWEWGYLKGLANPDTTQFGADDGQPIPERVESTAVSKNGEWIAAGTADGNITLWRFDTPDKPARVEYGGPVTAVVLLDDGSKLLAAGNDENGNHRVKQWALPIVAGADPEREYMSPEPEPINSLDISTDGRWLLAADAKGKLLVWDLNGDESTARLARTGTEASLHTARFSPDGEWIVAAGHDGFVRLWDAKLEPDPVNDTVRAAARLNKPEKPLYAAVFSPDSKYVLAAGDDRKIIAIAFDAEETRRAIEADRSGRAASPRVTAIRDRLADDAVDLSTANMRVIGEHDAAVRSLSFSDDGRFLFSSGRDHTVRVWDVSEGVLAARDEKVLRGHGGWVQSCAAMPGDANRVVSGGYDGRVHVWDWTKYQFPHILRADESQSRGASRLTQGAISPNQRWIATAADNGVVTVWDMQDPSNPRAETLTEGHDWQATSAAYFGDGGKHLLTAGGDNTAIVWDTNRGNELFRIGGWRNNQKGSGWRGVAVVSASGRYIATGAEGDALARVWRAGSGELVTEISQSTQAGTTGDERPEATAMAFSSDDQLLFIGDQYGAGYIIETNKAPADAQAGEDSPGFAGHTGKITAAKFLPNGHRLLTASIDGTVVLWDVDQSHPTPEVTFRHGDRVVAMDVSPDGSRMITAAGSGDEEAVLRLWNIGKPDNAEQSLTLDQLLGYFDRGTPEDASDRPLLRSVAFHPRELRIVVTMFDRRERRRPYSVGVWNWDDPGKPFTVVSNRPDVSTALYAPGEPEGILIVGGRGARLRLASTISRTYRPQSTVTALAFSSDNRHLVCGGSDGKVGTIKVWTLSESGKWEGSGDDPTLIGGHDKSVTSVAFHPQRNDTIVSVDEVGVTKLWRLVGTEWSLDEESQLGDVAGKVSQAVFIPVAGDFAVGTIGTAGLQFWTLGGQPHALQLAGADKPGCCVAASSNGRWIAVADGSTTWVWNTAQPQDEAKTLQGHSRDVTGLAFSPDGERLFTSSQDNSVKVWDLTAIWDRGDAGAGSERELLTLEGHTDEVTSVTVANDEQRPYVLTTGLDGQAIVWPSKSEDQ